MIWYARLLCHHPYAVLSSVVVVVVTCLVLSLTARPLPAFTDPSLGFESRGTVISQRAVAWENLLDASRPSGPLGVNPLNDPDFKDRLNSGNDGDKETDGDDKPPVHTHKVCIEMTPNGPVQVFDNCSSSTGLNASDVRELEETPIFALKVLVDMAERNDERGENPSEYNLENEWDQEHRNHNHENEHDDHLHNHDHIGEDGYFCNPVVPEYGHMVIKSTVPRDSLLTLKHLQTICQLDDRLRSPAEFKPICETWSPGRCCPSWTLPNYVAFLSNRTSCHHIKLEDVINVHRLLRRCARYLDLQLEGGCHGHIGCRRVPQVCLQHDAVYTILHYLVDAAFLNPEV